jgi:hypothetical protein
MNLGIAPVFSVFVWSIGVEQRYTNLTCGAGELDDEAIHLSRTNAAHIRAAG